MGSGAHLEMPRDSKLSVNKPKTGFQMKQKSVKKWDTEQLSIQGN